MEIQSLPYVDIQVRMTTQRGVMVWLTMKHDALAVFDDVEQGVVSKEDVWISGVSPPMIILRAR